SAVAATRSVATAATAAASSVSATPAAATVATQPAPATGAASVAATRSVGAAATPPASSASATPAAAAVATQPASDRGSRGWAVRRGGGGCRGRLTDRDRPHAARSRRESVINAVMWPAESRTDDSGDRGEVFVLAAGTELLCEDHSGGFQQP